MERIETLPQDVLLPVVRKRSLWSRLWSLRYLYLMLLPALIWAIIFQYGPMFGIYMAFINYQPGMGPFFQSFFHSKFLGLYWFQQFFTGGDFWMVMRNTMGISILSLLLSFPAPIILAIAINEIRGKYFKRVVQTVSYLPHFVSWVIVANIVTMMLSDSGFVNTMLMKLGFLKSPYTFFEHGGAFWWIIAITNMWKSMGWNSIIYLAALTGINPELYEAAKVDGATKLQEIWHITLPCLKPTMIILFILSIGGIMNAGFDQEYLMMNSTIQNWAQVVDTYTFTYGLSDGMFSYAAAVGLFRSVLSLILVVFVNQWSKRTNERALF